MKVYTNVQQKGGSGKTTSAVSIGALLVEAGQSVLLVDMDPQGGLSDWVGAEEHNMTALLDGKMEPHEAVEATEWERLDVVAANRSLARLEDVRAAKLAKRLEKLLSAAEPHYDFALIDAPPSTGSLVLACLLAADGVIAPVQAGQGAVKGFSDTLQLMRRVGGAPLVGAFACRVDMRTNSDQQVPALLKDNLGDRAFDTFIRETVRVREAETAHVPPPIYDATATATKDYQALTEEILSR